ncbi:MAG: PepSY domain-containing protein [Planctomycetota bacterium]
MLRLAWSGAVLAAVAGLSITGCKPKSSTFISEQEAVEAALAEVGGEVLGVRFDEPDTQWDVFIQSGDRAFEVEVEVDAVSGEVVAAEEESLEEIQAELAGDLSHEGVGSDVD